MIDSCNIYSAEEKKSVATIVVKTVQE